GAKYRDVEPRCYAIALLRWDPCHGSQCSDGRSSARPSPKISMGAAPAWSRQNMRICGPVPRMQTTSCKASVRTVQLVAANVFTLKTMKSSTLKVTQTLLFHVAGCVPKVLPQNS